MCGNKTRTGRVSRCMSARFTSPGARKQLSRPQPSFEYQPPSVHAPSGAVAPSAAKGEALAAVARAGRALTEHVEAADEARRERQREQKRERYRTDPEFREGEKARARGAHRKLDTADRLIRSAYQRAKKQGVPFSLTKTQVAQLWPSDGRCPVLGFRMLWDVEMDRAPSLDRFDRELGYQAGNVRIISFRANRIRGDASPHELLRVLAYAANPYPQLHTNADLRASYRGASPWGAGQPGDVTEITVKSGGKK